jgi:hypothetical protein
MNVHVKLYFMMYDVNYYSIFDIIHNMQSSYDYNYVNLITYLHHVAKLHMLNVM